MKKFLTFTTTLAIAASLTAQTLYVQTLGGAAQTPFALAEKPKITFGNGTMTVQQTSFQLSNVQNLSFTPNPNATNLHDGGFVGAQDFVPLPPLQAWISGDVIHIKGLTIGKPYRIFALSGMLVYQSIATHDIETYSGVSLPNGTYIIHSENQAIKIIKR